MGLWPIDLGMRASSNGYAKSDSGTSMDALHAAHEERLRIKLDWEFLRKIAPNLKQAAQVLLSSAALCYDLPCQCSVVV